ncbi:MULTISPECIES: hypothetical protein [unclassified Synechocystis]|uniref:hypothetical protein n=1 Tax=unclassified Synechocystis TaxID=2640012 RepID=UPI0003FBA166|nr:MULTISPECIES: hypothetical protein [unclassified Synechocystis]AIE75117.1 hypothetical protein D082_25880 [Synechocystis sp. PCC 6714]MCT0252883.1 hypothetical protein [Synechocystis sp. CS-94]
MFKQLGVFATFIAFAVALAVSGNIPSEITTLPQQSLTIAQQSKHQARLRLQRSLQQLLLRPHRFSGSSNGAVNPKVEYF